MHEKQVKYEQIVAQLPSEWKVDELRIKIYELNQSLDTKLSCLTMILLVCKPYMTLWC